MTRWNRFYQEQLEDTKLKALVKQELEALRISKEKNRSFAALRMTAKG